MDGSDWAIVQHLQRDGRVSVAALSRAVGLSPTAVSQRMDRLADDGVITGYTATVDPAALGLTLLAYVRMRPLPGGSKGFRRTVAGLPDVLECHHTTGDDCYLLKVVARDMAHLEQVTEQVAGYGETTTAVAYSSLITGRPITPDAIRRC